VDGDIYTALFVDGCSSYVYVKTLKSLSNFATIWTSFVARVEAEQGNQRAVANLITDSAYQVFNSLEMREFNTSKGIANFRSPPYTHELNHLVERTVGTITSMARAMLIHALAPVKLHGDAELQAAGYSTSCPLQRAVHLLGRNSTMAGLCRTALIRHGYSGAPRTLM
jgi:hypothetical protein